MRTWTYTRIFHSGDEYYAHLLEDIRSAKTSVTLETYIFSVDKLTLPILHALSEAQKRGCDVKMIVDGFGSYPTLSTLKRYCFQHNIALRIFNPIRFTFWMRRLNRRNHRKITIIDEKRAYLGSLNYEMNHCEQYAGPTAWRDTGVALEGPDVARLVTAFHLTYLRTFHWGLLRLLNKFHFIIPLIPENSILRLNSTQRTRRLLYRDLLRRINSAKDRVYITTAYFLPKRSLLQALVNASRRGVDVKILLPGKSDAPVVKWAAFELIHVMRRKGVRFYEYQKCILHAKTMILDDLVFVGSMNMNHRSLIYDLEVEAILSDKASLENFVTQWNADLLQSRQVTEADYRASYFVTRLIYRWAFRLRFLF